MVEALIVGCILAGGRSLRMGRDKRSELLGGKPLIGHAIDRLRGQVDRLMINANDEAARHAGFGFPVRPDPLPDFAGPLAGILAGLIWAAEVEAQALVTVPSDSPFFPHDLVARLEEIETSDIICAASGGRLHPVFALWRRPQNFIAALDHALKAEGLRKVESFVTRYRHRHRRMAGRCP